MNNGVFAIIVFFNPDISLIESAYESIISQVDYIVYVDNNSKNRKNLISWFKSKERIHYLLNTDNKGIAYAQNVGISCAIEKGASHVVLFDQDSVIDQHFISTLLETEKECLNNDIKVGVVSPVYQSFDGIKYPIVTLQNGRVHRIKQDSIIDYKIISHSIASGQLIRTSIFKEVGLMKDNYFIDMVDFEFCFRILRFGYKCIVTNKAIMHHKLGDNQLKIGRRIVGIYTPFRRYFTVRNSILFMKEQHVPFIVGFYYFKLALGKILLGITYGPNRLKQFRYCMKGLYDGLRNNAGKCSIQN